MGTAKVFWFGCSQAARLPKTFRFDTDEVRIRRHGNSVVLELIALAWAWLKPWVGPLDADVVAAAVEQPPEREQS